MRKTTFIFNLLNGKQGKNGNAAENNYGGQSAESSSLSNAAYVFGDFTVYNKRGDEIGFRFSNKLKSLFAILLFSSIGKAEGIPTPKLTALLWPERNLPDAKNIRGVTINHLRGILADIEGIELVHRNRRWFFIFSEPFYCDFFEVMDIIVDTISSNKELSNTEINTIRGIVRKGALFPDLRLDWIDRVKNDYENLLEGTIIKAINKHYEMADYASVIGLADIYFAIDPINEEVLATCIKSLRKTGRIKQARFLYNKFCEHYENSMGEPYTRTLLSEK